MNFYIADTHFGHNSVLNFDHRPFRDIAEMDRVLIKNWNARVTEKDDIYVVGDFAYKNEKPTEWYLTRLKGKKHLIVGNHDNRLVQNPTALSFFVSVDQILYVTDEMNRQNYQICLCHFPIAEWNGFYKGDLHVYGHIHSDRGESYQFMRTKKAYNAGCMINNYMPVTLDELIVNNKFHYNIT
ncbi:MAG: metallophosphoesterase [Acutalibacteraceae bacterium]